MKPTEEAVRDVIREHVFDPELGINLVDLGLIYDVQVRGEKIAVDMTLTSPGCPLSGTLADQVEEVLRQAFAGYDVEVNLVWEPRWTPEMMSEEVRRDLAAL